MQLFSFQLVDDEKGLPLVGPVRTRDVHSLGRLGRVAFHRPLVGLFAYMHRVFVVLQGQFHDVENFLLPWLARELGRNGLPGTIHFFALRLGAHVSNRSDQQDKHQAGDHLTRHNLAPRKGVCVAMNK